MAPGFCRWEQVQQAAPLPFRCLLKVLENSYCMMPTHRGLVGWFVSYRTLAAVARSPDPGDCEIVVNATPMGMCPQDPMPVPPQLLKSSIFVGDVVAGHGVTPFLRAAQSTGCKTADGSQMVAAGISLMLDFLSGK